MPILKEAGVSWVINEDYTLEMMHSVKVGLGCLRSDSEAFCILPVDIPLVRSRTLCALKNAFRKERHLIVYPTFDGQRGHPPVIPVSYADELSQWEGEGGLRGFLRQYDHRCLEVPVFDEGILMDMDTPEQYQRIVARYGQRRIPSRAECRALMASRFPHDHPVVKHGRFVARIGQVIGNQLIRSGWQVNVDLIVAGGVLHDIGKGEKDHAAFGADLLKKLGFANVSRVIASHMDLAFAKGDPVTEREVIYLADKMSHGESVVRLQHRLASKRDQLADNPEGKKAAEKRIRTAMRIEDAIENIIGKSLASLI